MKNIEKNLDTLVKKDINILEKEIYKNLVSYINPEFKEITKYQIKTGGKRLRPILAISSYRLLNGKGKDIIYPACGLELLHNYTLIIDDIIDKSPLRRKSPTLWKNFGRSIAECISSYYCATIFQLAIKSKKPVEISELFAKTLKVVMSGEIMDILFEQNTKEEELYIKKNRYKEIKKEDYKKMISKKTAFFLGSSCEIGGICNNGRKEDIKNLREYGFNLGMAFQISDDILDIFGKQKDFGKKIGKDIEDKKGGNCVICFAMEEFSKKEKKDFFHIFNNKEINREDTKKIIDMIKKTKAREKAFNYGNYFVEKGKKNLSLLPQNKWNNFLYQKIDKIMERSI